MATQKIYIGADHRGVDLKRRVVDFLTRKGYVIEDVGSDNPNASDDYPKYAKAVAKKVLASKGRAKGILVCGSGNGMAMAANRYKGIRAALCYTPSSAKSTREDNDANILCMNGDYSNKPEALRIANTFLTTEFSKAARHKRRIKQLDTLR